MTCSDWMRCVTNEIDNGRKIEVWLKGNWKTFEIYRRCFCNTRYKNTMASLFRLFSVRPNVDMDTVRIWIISGAIRWAFFSFENPVREKRKKIKIKWKNDGISIWLLLGIDRFDEEKRSSWPSSWGFFEGELFWSFSTQRDEDERSYWPYPNWTKAKVLVSSLWPLYEICWLSLMSTLHLIVDDSVCPSLPSTIIVPPVCCSRWPTRGDL